MKPFDAELYNEIQRLDDLLSGELPEEQPDLPAEGNALLVKNATKESNRSQHREPPQGGVAIQASGLLVPPRNDGHAGTFYLPSRPTGYTNIRR